MDDFPWQEVKSGDLERLQALLSSSSTARRGRALQDLRDRAGKMEESHPLVRLIMDKLTVVVGLFRKRITAGIAFRSTRTAVENVSPLRRSSIAACRTAMRACVVEDPRGCGGCEVLG